MGRLLFEAARLVGNEFRTRPVSTAVLFFGGALAVKALDEKSIRKANEKLHAALRPEEMPQLPEAEIVVHDEMAELEEYQDA